MKKQTTIGDSTIGYRREQIPSRGLIGFTRRLIYCLERAGRGVTAKRYGTVLRSFTAYTQGNEVEWSRLDSTLLSGYEEYLRRRGICRNSSSFYMRNLRAIVNRAAEMSLCATPNVFRHVYTGIDHTDKRAIPIEIMAGIRQLDLSEHPHLDFARKIFLFSFYTRGMSFVDMAFLKKTDLRGNVITYFRQKTRQKICVRVEKPLHNLLDSMDQKGGTYLLPLLGDRDKDDQERRYKAAYHRINRNLRRIGELVGLEKPLTMYVARHSWASAAQQQSVPLATISRAMGHDSERTTRIYLSSLDTRSVDAANKRVIDFLEQASTQ